MLKLLLLNYRFPSHDHTADRRTVLRLGNFLRRSGMEVRLLALATSQEEFARGPADREAFDSWEAVVKTPIESVLDSAKGLVGSGPLQQRFYYSSAMAKRLREAVECNDIHYVFAYHIRTAQYLPGLPVPTGAALQPAQVLHFGRRLGYVKNPFKRFVYGLETRRLRGYERDLAQKLDHVFVISKKDLDAIDPEGTLANVVLAPHGVNTEFFHPPSGNKRRADRLVMTGMMGVETNADAAVYMAREVFPLIRSRMPEVTLWIVGADPLRKVRRLHDPASGVVVTGLVEDMRPHLWEAAVAVNPIRIAAGLQNKVLEALAAGTPMVASARANEGLGIPAECLVVVEGGPGTFAECVLELLNDSAKRATLAKRGLEYVVANWSWDMRFHPIRDAIRGAVEGR